MKERADDMPTIDQCIAMAEKVSDVNFHPDEWMKDKKPEFYLGMIAGLRLGLSAVRDIKKTGDVEYADQWVATLAMMSAKLVVDKYELKGFKS